MATRDPTGREASEARVDADLALSELVETMERVDWREVPTVSTAEAAALTARLIEARDAVRDRPEGQP
jgi:hypothetical protein